MAKCHPLNPAVLLSLNGFEVGLELVKQLLATTNDLTVSAGHTGTKPVGIIQKGVGQTTLVADTGVTLLSEGGNLKLSSQYAAATLIPLGSDTYYVIGSLSA